MKLLIDQNISYRIIPLLEGSFPDIHHVRQFDLIDADDHNIFMYARENRFDAVITLDDDFVRLLNLFSAPPKIIWLRTGNCSTPFLSEILNSKVNIIQKFLNDEEFFLYEIFRP